MFLIVFVIFNPIMDSFLKGKLASAKAKLSSAAQYIQNKEIVKNV